MKRVLIIVCIIALALAVQQSTKMQSLKNVVVVGGSYVGSVSLRSIYSFEPN